MSDDSRSAQVHFRCTAAEKAAMEANAIAAGFPSLSAFLLARGMSSGRRASKRAAPESRTLSADTFERITALGETLNGQARAIHRGKPVTPADVFLTALEIGKAAATDPVLAVLIAGQTPAGGSTAPLSAAHYAALTRIGNNLKQIVASARFVTFGHQARGFQQFTDRWTAMLTVEADRITAARTGGRA